MARGMAGFASAAAAAALALLLQGCTEGHANMALVCGELQLENGKYTFACPEEAACSRNAKLCQEVLHEAEEECSVATSDTRDSDSGDESEEEDAFDERKSFEDVFKTQARGARLRPTLSRIFDGPGADPAQLRRFPYAFREEEIMPSDSSRSNAGSRSTDGSGASSDKERMPRQESMRLCMMLLPWQRAPPKAAAAALRPQSANVALAAAAAALVLGVAALAAAKVYSVHLRRRRAARDLLAAPALELGSAPCA